MTKEVRKELTTIAVLFALLIIISIIPAKGFLKFLLYLVPWALAGFELFKGLVEEIQKKSIQNVKDIKKINNKNLLTALTAILALIAGIYFEAVSAILLIRLADVFKDWTIKKATSSKGFAPNGCRTELEGLVSRLSKYFTPALLILSVLVFLIGLIVNISAWRDALHRSIICLAIAYPSALTISVPLAFVSGMGKAEKNGIVINGSRYIDKLAKCDTVVFEKTGTLTDGALDIKAVNPEKIGEEQLLEIACLAETYSDHPVALAIKKVAKGSIDKKLLGKAQEIAGLGVIASMAGKIIAVGNEKLMQKLGIEFAENHYTDSVVVHVALGSSYMGHIVMQDSVKENADKALYRLKSGGVKSIIMLTEDKMSDAARIAEALPAIDEFHPSLSKQDKATIIEQLAENQEKNEALAFVGKNVDRQLCGLADVSIALGVEGAEADVVIADGAIEKVPFAISLSEETMLTAKENVIGALAVKLVVLILGIVGVTNLTFAVFADVGITALAILNSMRIQFKK